MTFQQESERFQPLGQAFGVVQPVYRKKGSPTADMPTHAFALAHHLGRIVQGGEAVRVDADGKSGHHGHLAPG